MIKRREFITLLGGAAATWPIAARAQQRPALPVVGFLNAGSPEANARNLAAFRQGLREFGYVEGQNVAVEYRWAGGQYDRLPAMVAELVRRQPAVIVANTPGNLAVKAATTTIPIVFISGTDPVDDGLVASLSRPGGNVTGVANLSRELGPKLLEMLHEVVPTATVIALLVNPTYPNSETQSRDAQAAARSHGLQLRVLDASTDHEIEVAFASLAQLRAGGLVIGGDAFFFGRIELLAALALRHAVPTIFQDRAFVAAGGLMSYGGRFADAYRLAGVYTGRILKGDKPADLPVQQSTRIELIINMKTAKALGITFPLTLLGRADAVIE